MKEQKIEDRIIGALLGLACGDALGAPAEFKSQEDIQARFGILKEMVGGGVWEPGETTDDTGMGLCIAEGILTHPDDPIEATGQNYLQWKKTAKDVGTTISAALGAFRGNWPAAAQSTPQARQGKAAGNGSLMRTLPVALAYPDEETMLRMSARLSSMTHWDAQAEVCCAVYCLWVQYLLKGLSLREGWHLALQHGAEVAQRGSLSPDTVGTQPLPAGFWERLQAVESLQYEQLQPSGYAGYVLECLEAAAWCVLKTDSYEEAMIKAVNLAGEADTIAAVAGGVAGAYWGREAVPRRWLDKLHKRIELDQTAQRLIALRRHSETYATPGLPPFNSNEVAERIVAGRNPLTCRDVETLHAQGITHILDLREPHEWAETNRFGQPQHGAEAVEEIDRCGLHRLNVPVTDMGAPTPDGLDASCRFLEEALQDADARVYVHCRAGMERTAAVLVAYYARRYQLSYDEALAKLREGRSILRPLPNQAQAVRRWLASK